MWHYGTNVTHDISQVQWRPDHRPAGEVDPAAGHDRVCAQVYCQVMSLVIMTFDIVIS